MGETSGSVLEDFLESVVTVPVYIRRPLRLIHELDKRQFGLSEVVKRLGAANVGNSYTSEEKLANFTRIKDYTKEIVELSDEKINASVKLEAILDRTLSKTRFDLKKLEKRLLADGQITQAEVDALYLGASKVRMHLSSSSSLPVRSSRSDTKSAGVKNSTTYFSNTNQNISSKRKALQANDSVTLANPLEALLSKIPVLQETRSKFSELEKRREAAASKKEPLLFKSAQLADLKAITSRLHPVAQQAYLRHHLQQLQYNRKILPGQKFSSSNKNSTKQAQRKRQKVTKSSSSRVLAIGNEVAALVKGTIGYGVAPDEALWILGRIAELNSGQMGSRSVTVADADNQEVTYKVNETKVVKLVQREDANAARLRLPKVNEIVLAMYPDSTTFYKSTLRKGPHINDITQDLVCLVKFFDDEDETGIIREKTIPVRYVFQKSGLM